MQDAPTALFNLMRRDSLALRWGRGARSLYEHLAQLGAGQSGMLWRMEVLREAGLVRDRPDAQWVHFRRNRQLSRNRAARVDAGLTTQGVLARTAA